MKISYFTAFISCCILCSSNNQNVHFHQFWNTSCCNNSISIVFLSLSSEVASAAPDGSFLQDICGLLCLLPLLALLTVFLLAEAGSLGWAYKHDMKYHQFNMTRTQSGTENGQKQKCVLLCRTGMQRGSVVCWLAPKLRKCAQQNSSDSPRGKEIRGLEELRLGSGGGQEFLVRFLQSG